MKTSKPHWPVTPALLVLCALLSLTACTSAPKKSAPQIIQEPLPESLTAKLTSRRHRPADDVGRPGCPTDSLLDALDTCNADKAGIRELELRRITGG